MYHRKVASPDALHTSSGQSLYAVVAVVVVVGTAVIAVVDVAAIASAAAFTSDTLMLTLNVTLSWPSAPTLENVGKDEERCMIGANAPTS